MSVVVTKVLEDEIVMAADSQMTAYGTVTIKEDAKIFQVDGLTIGSSGYARDGALLRIFCETHSPRSATCEDILAFMAEFDVWMRGRTNNAEMDSQFHIVYRGKAFYINDYHIQEITDHHAIGSGFFYALGALHARATPEQAVEAACALNIYCALPVNVFRVPRVDEELT